MADEPPDAETPRRRWFVVRRLDRNLWWPVSTEAEDDEIEAVLRGDGFDSETRRPPKGFVWEPSAVRASEDTSLEGRRWVRIMADFYADGVWNLAGESCLSDDLPISTALLKRLQAWQEWYDRDCDQEERIFDLKAFAAEGLAIARAVKAELPDWTVVYHDESKAGDYRGPRFVFEYEITLPEPG